MLILTRRPGERIMIGDDVVVTFVSRRGEEISIGIDAPPSVSIDREEVLLNKNQEASENGKD